MARKPVIAVVGSGIDSEPAVSNARELGRLIAEQGWVLITGGRNAGVMRAANEGAKQPETLNSITVGILPDRDTAIAPDVDVAIITGAGEARNNIIVLSADVVIACGVDDPGTASEISLALKAGKPVVFLGVTDSARGFFKMLCGDRVNVADSPNKAVEIVRDLLAFHP